MKKFKEIISRQSTEQKEIRALFQHLGEQQIVLETEFMEVFRCENYKTFRTVNDIITAEDDAFFFVNEDAFNRLLNYVEARNAVHSIMDKFKDLVANPRKIPLITYDMVTKPGMNYDKMDDILRKKAVQL